MMLNYYNVFQAKLKAEKLQIPKKTSQHLPIKSLLDSFVTAWHVLSRLFFSFQARRNPQQGNSGDDAPNRECWVRKELPANELPADALKQTSVP